MRIQVLEQKPDFLRILLEEVEPAYANALRRVLMADVPKMAIEDIEYHLGPIRDDDGKEYESVTPLFDEIIAHRLGLVPIPTALGLYNRRDTCPTCHGEGCTNCTIIYSLNKRGPGTVTSGDLEPIGDAKLKPVDTDIPIVELGEGQAMLVYATAILGTGQEHAKWQATHGVGYRYYPILKVGNKSLDPLDPSVSFCSSHMETTSLEETEVELKADCQACKKFMDAYKTSKVSVGNDPTRILLQFETDRSLTSRDVVVASLDILRQRFADLADQVGTLT